MGPVNGISSKDTSSFNKIVLLKSLLYLIKVALFYLSFFALAEIILICILFLVISGINFSQGDLNLSSLTVFIPLLKWLGIDHEGTYGTQELLSVFSKASTILAFMGFLINLISKKVFKKEFKISKTFGFIIITTLFLLSILSAFSPLAKSGALSMMPILILFWVLALGGYAWYLLLDFFIALINKGILEVHTAQA